MHNNTFKIKNVLLPCGLDCSWTSMVGDATVRRWFVAGPHHFVGLLQQHENNEQVPEGLLKTKTSLNLKELQNTC